MPDLVATAGSATANSFTTTDEAEAYLDARLNSGAWLAATDDDRARSLIEATRELTFLAYVGDRTTDTQALSWPRLYAIDPDKPQIVGVDDLAQLYFDDDVVPTRIKNATSELALEFLKAGSSDLAALDTLQNIIRKKVDVLETEYSDPQTRVTGLARFPRVMMYISELLDLGDSGPGLEIVRV